jgi:tetratricopeptide (TPR) repeat protein
VKTGDYVGAIRSFSEAIPSSRSSRAVHQSRISQRTAREERSRSPGLLASHPPRAPKSCGCLFGPGSLSGSSAPRRRCLCRFLPGAGDRAQTGDSLERKRGRIFPRRQYALALRDYEAAIKANPRFAPAFQSRAAARQATGDTAGAAADLKVAEQLRSQEKECDSSFMLSRELFYSAILRRWK